MCIRDRAAGHLAIDVQATNIDLLSLSGHKFDGPKGAGALYTWRGIALQSVLYGGGQERGHRAGTENVPAIAGLAAALAQADANLPANTCLLYTSKQGQRSQSARGFCPRSTMRVPQPDIIEHFGNADTVPQPPERCLSRQAGIVRCCLYNYCKLYHR